jgi:hypothetical protein
MAAALPVQATRHFRGAASPATRHSKATALPVQAKSAALRVHPTEIELQYGDEGAIIVVQPYEDIIQYTTSLPYNRARTLFGIVWPLTDEELATVNIELTVNQFMQLSEIGEVDVTEWNRHKHMLSFDKDGFFVRIGKKKPFSIVRVTAIRVNILEEDYRLKDTTSNATIKKEFCGVYLVRAMQIPSPPGVNLEGHSATEVALLMENASDPKKADGLYVGLWRILLERKKRSPFVCSSINVLIDVFKHARDFDWTRYQINWFARLLCSKIRDGVPPGEEQSLKDRLQYFISFAGVCRSIAIANEAFDLSLDHPDARARRDAFDLFLYTLLWDVIGQATRSGIWRFQPITNIDSFRDSRSSLVATIFGITLFSVGIERIGMQGREEPLVHFVENMFVLRSAFQHMYGHKHFALFRGSFAEDDTMRESTRRESTRRESTRRESTRRESTRRERTRRERTRREERRAHFGKSYFKVDDAQDISSIVFALVCHISRPRTILYASLSRDKLTLHVDCTNDVMPLGVVDMNFWDWDSLIHVNTQMYTIVLSEYENRLGIDSMYPDKLEEGWSLVQPDTRADMLTVQSISHPQGVDQLWPEFWDAFHKVIDQTRGNFFGTIYPLKARVTIGWNVHEMTIGRSDASTPATS